jgi:hypothetical protein
MMGPASAFLSAVPEEWGFEEVEDHPQGRGTFTQGLYNDHEGGTNCA